MASARRGRNPAGEEGEGYFASVADLMVGMLFVFIIMLMAFALNFRSAEQRAERTEDRLEGALEATARERDRLAEQRDELLRRHAALGEVSERLVDLEAKRARLLEDIALDLGRRDVPVTLDAANGVLRLPESLLFESGEATLRPEGERALAIIAQALADTLPCYSGGAEGCAASASAPTDAAAARPLLEAVLVEGHTDEVPVRRREFADNWALSAARGVNTFKALTRFAPALERLRNPRGEALLGVAGYEARRPVAVADTPEARRLNRRIDLRFLVAAPSEAELAPVLERLGAGTGASADAAGRGG